MGVICLYIVGTWCVVEERIFTMSAGSQRHHQPGRKSSFPSPSMLLDSLGPENSGLILKRRGRRLKKLTLQSVSRAVIGAGGVGPG